MQVTKQENEKINSRFKTLGRHHLDFNIFNMVGEILNHREIKLDFTFKPPIYCGLNGNK